MYCRNRSVQQIGTGTLLIVNDLDLANDSLCLFDLHSKDENSNM